MQFLNCLKVALLVSGTAFTMASLPVAKFADERVDVQFNRSQIFSGQARDAAAAYLSLAGLISMSLGVTGFSLAAWRQTRSRLAQTKQTVAELEDLVKQREQQLELAQLSPARIQQTGLQEFLEGDDLAELGFAPMNSSPATSSVEQVGQTAWVEPGVPANQSIPSHQVIPAHHETVHQPVSASHVTPIKPATPVSYVGASGHNAPAYPAVPGHQPVQTNYASPSHQPVPSGQPTAAYQSAPMAHAIPAEHAIAAGGYPQQVHQAAHNSAPVSKQQHQLSPSQVAQLQAVQAQLQQQHRQVQQTLATNRAAARRSNGFTVINPYQVQVGGHPSRLRSA